jgi:hypothetical protein
VWPVLKAAGVEFGCRFLITTVSVRFQIPTVASMKMTVFWDVAPCIVVEVYRRFSGAYCLHHLSDERSSETSETSVDFCRTTRRSIPADGHRCFC